MLPKLILFGEIWAAAICFFAIAYLSYCFFAGDIGKKNRLGGTCLALSFFCLLGVLLTINSWIAEAAAIVIISGVLAGMGAFACQGISAKIIPLVRRVKVFICDIAVAGLLYKSAETFCLFFESNDGRRESSGLGPFFALFIIILVLAIIAFWIYSSWHLFLNAWNRIRSVVSGLSRHRGPAHTDKPANPGN
jgi:hypothetical protein